MVIKPSEPTSRRTYSPSAKIPSQTADFSALTRIVDQGPDRIEQTGSHRVLVSPRDRSVDVTAPEVAGRHTRVRPRPMSARMLAVGPAASSCLQK